MSHKADRQHNDEALRDREEQLRFVLEGSDLGFWDWNLETGEVQRNARWAEILGYSSDEIQFTVRQWLDLVHPDDREAAWRSIDDHLKGRSPRHRIEYRMLAKDGRIRWILDCAKIVKQAPDGRVLRMCGTHTDVTERREQEAALRKSEELYRLMAENVSDVVWMLDLNGHFIYQSPSVQRLRGLTVEEALRQSLDEVLVADSLTVARREILRLIEGRGRHRVDALELEMYRNDGSRIWTEVSLSLVLDTEGRPEKIVGVMRDISERKTIENRELARNHLLELVAKGAALPPLLDAIVRSVQDENHSYICSILLVNNEGKRLLIGASPSMPDFYNEAVNGLAIGPNVGSCGAAAYTGQRVIVEDIQSHPNWAPYKELAARAGLGACWSEPIVSSHEKVLGTFAIYHAAPHIPDAADIALIEYAAHLAGIAIEHHQIKEELERRAHLDYLTGLANRRYFLEQAEVALAAALRYGRALSVLMLDIDRFKPINDTHGHQVGDLTLQKLSETCRQTLRKVDLIGRWGGEEFVVLLPETEGQSAFEGAERLRQALADTTVELPSGHPLHFTVSIGLASLSSQDSTIDALIQRADQALYVAKREGRNQVCWAHGQTDFLFLPEHRRARSARETERNAKRWARAIETARDGCLVADATGRLLEVNDALCRITGYERGELLSPIGVKRKEAGMPEEIFEDVATVVAQGKAHSENRWHRKTGELIDVDISVTYLPEDGGLYFAFIRDITPMRRT